MSFYNRTEKFWDMISSKTDRIAKKFEHTYIKSIERSKKYLNADNIVLDYACGTGLLCIEISDNVKKIYAIDISSKMIEIAKRKAYERKIANIQFEKITIFDERYKRESFDVIFAFNILHLLRESDKVINRINELLKPGGIFISTTECIGENRTSFINILAFLLSKIGIVPYLRFFKVSELEDLLFNGKFQIVETENFYNLSQPNHFIVAKKK